ncbi:hypothetical protein [Synechococcus sp. CS-1325]|uniref:hypothetical protein n=1 Tax=Synechococcus sp. CS-1325 TaxID=2847979 RepID=UPI00223BEF95|nr:hypothetical protein [Synechococcus sp. CS-1325]
MSKQRTHSPEFKARFAKEAELLQQIGQLQIELEWLKKSLICSDACDLRKLVDHDHPDLNITRRC